MRFLHFILITMPALVVANPIATPDDGKTSTNVSLEGFPLSLSSEASPDVNNPTPNLWCRNTDKRAACHNRQDYND